MDVRRAPQSTMHARSCRPVSERAVGHRRNPSLLVCQVVMLSNCILNICVTPMLVLLPTLVREATFCNGQQLIQRLKINPSAENKWLSVLRPNQIPVTTAPLPRLGKHHGGGNRKNAVTGAWEEWLRKLSGRDVIIALLSTQPLMTTADQDSRNTIRIWAGARIWAGLRWHHL